MADESTTPQARPVSIWTFTWDAGQRRRDERLRRTVRAAVRGKSTLVVVLGPSRRGTRDFAAALQRRRSVPHGQQRRDGRRRARARGAAAAATRTSRGDPDIDADVDPPPVRAAGGGW